LSRIRERVEEYVQERAKCGFQEKQTNQKKHKKYKKQKRQIMSAVIV
jgi:Zn ribbon nucleic-acid-binding protein